MKKTGIVTLLMILGSFYTKSQNNALSNNPNRLSLTEKFTYFNKNLYTVKFPNNNFENFKSTSVTYWQPTLEWHYTYDSNTNLWVLSDSTRYIYNTSPAIVNGLINTAFSYLLSPPQIFKDTFSYNSNGNHILHKNILLGSTPGAFTVNYVHSSRYYPNNKIKGSTTYNWQFDNNNCMGNGNNYTLIFGNRDTNVYQGNYSHIYLEKFYQPSTCQWFDNSSDTTYRNANNIPKKRVFYFGGMGSLSPMFKEQYTHDASDNITEVLIFNYNLGTNQWDTSGKLNNISYYYYDKYELNNCIPLSATYYFYNYTTHTFDISSKFNYFYDSNGNLVKYINFNWNGSSFDTSYIFIRDIFYQNQTIGSIDSIIERNKSFPSTNFNYTDKYIYLSGQVFTSINKLNNINSPFTLYPNPANDFIQFKSANNNQEIIDKIEIFDLQGRPLFISKDPYVSVENFSKGIYFAEIITRDGNKYQFKFVKN